MQPIAALLWSEDSEDRLFRYIGSFGKGSSTSRTLGTPSGVFVQSFDDSLCAAVADSSPEGQIVPSPCAGVSCCGGACCRELGGWTQLSSETCTLVGSSTCVAKSQRLSGRWEGGGLGRPPTPTWSTRLPPPPRVGPQNAFATQYSGAQYSKVVQYNE